MERLTPVKKNIKRVAKAYKKYAEVDAKDMRAVLDRAMELSSTVKTLTEGKYTPKKAVEYIAYNIELVGAFARAIYLNKKQNELSSQGFSDLITSMEYVMDKLLTKDVTTYPELLDKVAETIEVAVKRGVTIMEVIKVDLEDGVDKAEKADKEVEHKKSKKSPYLVVGSMWLSLSQVVVPDDAEKYKGYSVAVDKSVERKAIESVQFSVYTLLANLTAGARQMQGSSKSMDADEIIEDIIELGYVVGREEAFKRTLQEVVDTLEEVKVSKKGSINGKSSVAETLIVNILYSLISMSSIPEGVNVKARQSLSGLILSTVAGIALWADKDAKEIIERFEAIVNDEEEASEMTLQEFAEAFLNK